MKKRILAALILALMLIGTAANAERLSANGEELNVVTRYRMFFDRYKNRRDRKVTYYDNVYAVNHGKYGFTPFDSNVPAEYFIVDEAGYLAVAPFVLDVTDAMRVRLYGHDAGEVAMFYGQFCEQTRDRFGRWGFTGVHEGIDFINARNVPLYAILDGVVTRAGDSNGTVGVYNEQYDITLLYLHCQKIDVKRGDVIKAGDLIAREGKKKAGSYYTHVEFRKGRHTSSSPYRDTKLESDCPYAVLGEALGIESSDRQAVTYAEQLNAERMRLEAEAAAKAAAALAAAEAAKPEEIPAEETVELVDVLPGAGSGYGFETPAEETTPAAEATPTVAPEATLPPSGV